VTDLDTQARKLIADAVEDIEQHGWHQGDYFDDSLYNVIPQECPACVLGALCRGTGLLNVGDALHDPVFYRAELLLQNALELDGALPIGLSIGRWNDAEDRTQEEVLALMRKVAEG
jgi:hypothetical protein